MTHALLSDHSPFQPLRREDDRLLRGQGRFVANLPADGALHVAFARSAHACARIRRLDLEALRRLPGVVAVLGPESFAAARMPAINPLLPLSRPFEAGLMASDQTRHVGQVLAVVVAHSAVQAWQAAQQLEGEFEPQPDRLRLDFAGSTDPLLALHHGDGGAPGSAADAAQASVPGVTVDIALHLPRVAAMAMEPRSALMHWDEAGQLLQAWLGSQAPSRARADLAACLQVRPEQVRLHAVDVGGAFGARASIAPEELLLALASRLLGRPLRWVSRRSEEFMAAPQGRGARLQGQLQVGHDGRLQALRADLEAALGAWLPFSAVVPLRNAARILPGPYHLRQVAVQGRADIADAAPVNIYRGAGRPEAALLMEALIERAARRLGMDPLALRRINLVTAADMPYCSASGEVLDSGDYPQLLERAAQRFDYEAARRSQQQRRAQGEWVGIGTAFYVEPCGQGWEAARLTWHEDGSLTLGSGSPAQGQGHETTYGALVAREMGVDPAQVTVILGDSLACPEGIGALASRSTAIAGSAIVQACRDLRAARAQGQPLPIVIERRFDSREAWSHGCVMVSVKIDEATGAAQIERLVWVDDAGVILEPVLARGQLLGGLAQGFGQAMMERIVYDAQGQLVTGSLMDYAVPRADDLPEVLIDSLCSPSPNNLLGAKGVGEAGCIGVPAALYNAVADALSPLGEARLDWPLRAETIWRALRALRSLEPSRPDATSVPASNS